MDFSPHSMDLLPALGGRRPRTAGRFHPPYSQEAESRGIEELTEEMTDYWLENYLFPSKKPSSKGYLEEDWFYVHKELLKKNMTLRLLHREYEQKAKLAHKIPYAYRTYCTHYGNYAHKYKLTMPIKRKPGEITEIDWAKCKALHFPQSVSRISPGLRWIGIVNLCVLPKCPYFSQNVR